MAQFKPTSAGIFVLTGLALLAAQAVLAATARTVHLTGYGTLTLIAPEDWKMEVSQATDQRDPTIRFTQGTGAAFEVHLTTTLDPQRVLGLSDIRAFVAKVAKELEPQLVERPILLKEFSGVGGEGYYFRGTDRTLLNERESTPDDYKYTIRGALRVNGVLVAFRIFVNDGQENVSSAALEMLRRARHQDSLSAGRAPAKEGSWILHSHYMDLLARNS